jgi:2'-5' RNA ligase
VRAFVALPLASQVREPLVHAASQLHEQAWAGPVRWVPPENLHLTIRFLGEVAEASIHGLRARLAARLVKLDCFCCEIVGLSLFPSSSRPRVVAAQMSSEPRLVELAGAVESVVVEAGFDPESRQFHAHITLGRFGRPDRSGSGLTREMKAAMKEAMPMELRVPRIEVCHVVLYRSELGRQGARYRELERIALAGPVNQPDGPGDASS